MRQQRANQAAVRVSRSDVRCHDLTEWLQPYLTANVKLIESIWLVPGLIESLSQASLALPCEQLGWSGGNGSLLCQEPSPANASADLITFLQADPRGRMRRGGALPSVVSAPGGGPRI